MNLYTWAAKWQVPLEAVRDLQMSMGLYTPELPAVSEAHGKSEAWVQSVVRLEASAKGVKLFRNNVGALKDSTGRLVRYGLGNDSPQLNDVIKSADLIGWRTVNGVAQFVSREVKAPGWQYTGAGREPAQLAWINMVNAAGGDAAFATGEGTL